MIDDGTIPSPAERLAYQKGLETLARFDPTAPIVGINPDGSRRHLTAIEELTNDIFNVTTTYGRPIGVDSVVVRNLKPIDLTDGNWIEQSLRVDDDGTAVQLGNRYMGMLPRSVKAEYLYGNGSLYSTANGVLVYRGYGADEVSEIGLLGRTRLWGALRSQRNDSINGKNSWNR